MGDVAALAGGAVAIAPVNGVIIAASVHWEIQCEVAGRYRPLGNKAHGFGGGFIAHCCDVYCGFCSVAAIGNAVIKGLYAIGGGVNI